MAIIIDKDGNVVTVENEPEEAHAMFPNLQTVLNVLIGEASIVDEHGNAIIPIASAQGFGVVKTAGNFGTGVNQNGLLYIVAASDQHIKQATDGYRPIVPTKQHLAAFYGMAAAAGDTTQALSDNAVGNYTDQAKIAIQKMLGVYNEWELLNDITLDSNTDAVSIETDFSGNNIYAKKLFAQVFFTAATTQADDFFHMMARAELDNGTIANCYAPVGRWRSGGAAGYNDVHFELIGSVLRSVTKTTTSVPNSGSALNSATSEYDTVKSIRGCRFAQYSESTSLLTAGTRIKVWGIRQ